MHEFEIIIDSWSEDPYTIGNNAVWNRYECYIIL